MLKIYREIGGGLWVLWLFSIRVGGFKYWGILGGIDVDCNLFKFKVGDFGKIELKERK